MILLKVDPRLTRANMLIKEALRKKEKPLQAVLMQGF